MATPKITLIHVPGGDRLQLMDAKTWLLKNGFVVNRIELDVGETIECKRRFPIQSIRIVWNPDKKTDTYDLRADQMWKSALQSTTISD
jgi:hypothetical protein